MKILHVDLRVTLGISFVVVYIGVERNEIIVMQFFIFHVQPHSFRCPPKKASCGLSSSCRKSDSLSFSIQSLIPPVFFSSFDGFRTRDMIKTDGSFYTWSDLQVKGLHSKNFLSWHGLIDALPVKWKTS